MWIVFLTLIVALLAAATPIFSDETTESALSTSFADLFQLGNECKPINLSVEGVGSKGAAIGLTQEAVTTTVRSRLRAARLYRIGGGPYSGSHLYVNVNVMSGGTAFSIILELRKPLSDPNLNGLEGFATTWDRSMIGQSREASYILSWVSQLTDEFIDEYLRVNEPTCPRSPIDP